MVGAPLHSVPSTELDSQLCAEVPLSEVDRAVCERETVGFVQLVYLGPGAGKLLGATVVSTAEGTTPNHESLI